MSEILDPAESFDVVIVGGGQAGLAAGHEIARTKKSFVILDGGTRVGDAWRNRWDSLRLFTPAHFSELPGLRFPGPRHASPTKDAMADYLESYAQHFALPVRLGVQARRIKRDGDRFIVDAGHQRFLARAVIVATGGHHHPATPAFAGELDPSIVQIHSAHYRNQSQLQDGDVLLVGAGNSGADIAMDLAKSRRVWLAGRDVGHVPFRIDTPIGKTLVFLVRFAGQHVLTRRSPLGRKVLAKLSGQGNPLVRVKPKDLEAAGVIRTGRIAGVRDGRPVLDDGRVVDVSNVLWCTGFRPDWSWVDAPIFDDNGSLSHRRGISPVDGLYFVGLPFQFAATSDTITGLRRDIRYVRRSLDAYLRRTTA